MVDTDFEWLDPAKMKPSDRAKWDIHKTYVCHPIAQGTAADHFPLNGKQWREYVQVVWKGPNRVETFSMWSNYWLRPMVKEKRTVPVQLMLI